MFVFNKCTLSETPDTCSQTQGLAREHQPNLSFSLFPAQSLTTIFHFLSLLSDALAFGSQRLMAVVQGLDAGRGSRQHLLQGAGTRRTARHYPVQSSQECTGPDLYQHHQYDRVLHRRSSACELILSKCTSKASKLVSLSSTAACLCQIQHENSCLYQMQHVISYAAQLLVHLNK